MKKIKLLSSLCMCAPIPKLPFILRLPRYRVSLCMFCVPCSQNIYTEIGIWLICKYEEKFDEKNFLEKLLQTNFGAKNYDIFKYIFVISDLTTFFFTIRIRCHKIRIWIYNLDPDTFEIIHFCSKLRKLLVSWKLYLI